MRCLLALMALTAVTSASADNYSNCPSGSCNRQNNNWQSQGRPVDRNNFNRQQDDNDNRYYQAHQQADLTDPHDTYRAGDLLRRAENSNAQRLDTLQDSAASQQDEQLNARLRQRLRNWVSNHDFDAIIIKTNQGNVILLGSIEKNDDVKKIEEQVKTIDGVRSVDNQLKSKE